ncbi:putative bifunctional diguanylate cyclase/phosphodiesterase [Aquipuribacter nitratireducens]|uniref:Bifunctional diguanylate cyclase/phosphodiesterase n=1 Tax=Aquipuribacter nitratireducens TaxID=650104 RepID=A0ABW0GPG1_9MICO
MGGDDPDEPVDAPADPAAAAFATSPVGTLVTDHAGVVVDVNHAICRLLGLRRDEVVGRGAMDLVSGQDRHLADAERGRMHAGAAGGRFTCRVVDAAGASRWTRWTWRALAPEGRQPYAVLHVEDVDRASRTLLVSDDLLAAVEDERAALTATLEAIPDGLAIFHAQRDEAGEVVDVRLVRINRTGAAGIPPDRLVGLSVLDYFPESRATGLFDALLDTLRHGRTNRLLIEVGEHGTWPGTFENVVVRIDEDRVLSTFRDVSQARDDAQRLLHAATHDALTGLPNRVLLRDRVEHALQRTAREGHPVAVAFLDLDGFKAVNDTHGHRQGDVLLQEVARRLSDAVREEDTVARLGGDEFVLVLERVGDEAEWRHVHERVVAALARPFLVAGQAVTLRASVGVVFPPKGQTDADAVLGNADIAMYASKSTGKARYTVFTEQHRRRVIDLVALEADLGKALTREEFSLHFQGIVDVTSGDVVGAEALLRWQHPRRGLLSPADFLPAAEAGGLMVDVGAWVLEEALRQAARWRLVARRDCFVTVNVSAQQLVRGDYVRRVRQALAGSGVPSRSLVVEITESQVLPSSASVLDQLRELRDLGVQVAVDDFGTGYSSLSHLATLPVDLVKIDRAFLTDLADSRRSAVLRSAVEMTRAVGATCVVEGIETQEQYDAVRATGARFAQGFLLGRPRPGYVV